jgi:hypothetical protein
MRELRKKAAAVKRFYVEMSEEFAQQWRVLDLAITGVKYYFPE